MVKWSFRLAVFIGLTVCACAPTAASDNGTHGVLSLAGEWQFRADPQNCGRQQQWFLLKLPDKIKLPGTVTGAGFGYPVNTSSLDGPSPVATYQVPAWYRREVQIPQAWRGKRIVLFLERANWVTGVWANGQFAGMRNSLAAPHVYDLTRLLAAGRNYLIIMVDNSAAVTDYIENPGEPPIPSLGPAGPRHCEQRYNGILGRIELQATDPIWIESVNAYPDVAGNKVQARIRIGNVTGHAATAKLVLSVLATDRSGASYDVRQEVPISSARTQPITLEASLAKPMGVWNEFTPRLCSMTAAVAIPSSGQPMADRCRVTFGMRQLGRNGSQLLLNGKPIFLRGRVDCAVFPLTEHAPMDVPAWRTILRRAKAYGLNHFRFHSWCPPEAAFEAADEMGFLFQVEPTGFSGSILEDDTSQAAGYALAECLRIVETYGNHPSFGFLSVGGNERLSIGHPYKAVVARRQAMLIGHLARVREKDSRHLYTCTTHPWTQGRTDDFYITGWGKATYPNGRPVRLYASNWGGPDMLKGSRFLEEAPETTSDYRRGLEGIDGPVIVHEVGQWAVFPNIAEIGNYTGAWRAGNLELIRQQLEKKGTLGQAQDFVRASGQLSLRLYREEIESALRTPGLAGLDLLDLIDYPWQATATVGVLDAFWDSKGLISPEEFREFCGPTVVLARLPKRTWRTTETLRAEIDVAHYGPGDLADASVERTLSVQGDKPVASGRLATTTIPSGGLKRLGTIEVPLQTVPSPAKLILRASTRKGSFSNHWDLWIYPDTPAPAVFPSVEVFTEWNRAAKSALAQGGRVLLLPGQERIVQSLPGIFTPVYWSWRYFKDRQVGTMGLLCDPQHPALAGFPTEFHSDWQWWEPITHSRTMILDDLPRSLKPILQVIDKFDSCRRLGAIFEARVGSGRLLVCSIDLNGNLDQRPVSQQLKRSLLTYMASERFRPAQSLQRQDLDALFVNSPADQPAPVSSP